MSTRRAVPERLDPSSRLKVAFFGNTGGQNPSPTLPLSITYTMIGTHPSERPVYTIAQALGSVSVWYERSDATSLYLQCSRVNILPTAKPNPSAMADS
jgi:hypothetical protein